MIVAENKKVIGIIGVADALKEDSIEAIRRLNSFWIQNSNDYWR